MLDSSHEKTVQYKCAQGGNMYLLLERVDTNTIRLVRSWYINFMLIYLHNSVNTLTSGLSDFMVEHGDYAFIMSANRV